MPPIAADNETPEQDQAEAATADDAAETASPARRTTRSRAAGTTSTRSRRATPAKTKAKEKAGTEPPAGVAETEPAPEAATPEVEPAAIETAAPAETEVSAPEPAGAAPAGPRAEEVSDLARPADGWRRRKLFGRSLVGVISVALAVIVVAVLVWALIDLAATNHKAERLDSLQSLRASALAQGTQYGVYLSSYDFSNLDGPGSPWAEVDAHATPSFRTDFDKTKASLTKLVQDYKAKATGKVVAAGVSSVTPSQAVVLLFVDQTIDNTVQKSGPTTQPLRVQLVLVRQHGTWLIDKLQVPS